MSRIIARFRNLFPFFTSSVLNSYTQIFFSNNKVFAVILMVVTFFDFYAGLCGFLSVLISNILAYIIGFNRDHCKAGYYGFNSLLVGLGIGVFYDPNLVLFILLFFVAILTLFLTVMTEGVIGKYGLPFLSMAFLLGIWLVTLASRQFTALQISEKGIYTMNEMYSFGGLAMVRLYNYFNNLSWDAYIKTYFRSLGAILFQYHLVPGILVAVGLLIYSRIAFLLSLVGFYSAYLYYYFFGANFAGLSYGYIGFNFILTSIAIGGFFIISSRYSFGWVVLLTPLISIFVIGTDSILSLFQLPVFSLPFNLVVILFLYVMKFRERFFHKPQMVLVQHYSPEKNLYSHLNAKDRFGTSFSFQFALPFIGEWKVTQGHNGEYTHQGDWKHAWDFQIEDEEGSNHLDNGIKREDYFCFGKPVTCPADGWVEEIDDTVEDNEPGKVNLEQNWGNTIVIRHADQLYSKLSHLRKGSFKVKEREFVKKGEVIAQCGNSGRSPVPHLHFQIQSTPYIGSKTLDWPFGHYIRFRDGHYNLKSYDRPVQDENVSNIQRNSALEKAFHFIPGKKIEFTVSEESKKPSVLKWEIVVDSLNNTYIYCELSHSRAYFNFDGDILYFTHFEGDRKSVLFYFYLSAFKVMTGFYKDLEIRDSYPLNVLSPDWLIFLQDFIAPFYIFIHPDYSLRYGKMQDDFAHVSIEMNSSTIIRTGGKKIRKIEGGFILSNHGLDQFRYIDKNRIVEIKTVRVN